MTDKIKEQIIEISENGEVNMMDAKSVQYIADREGFHELVIFIEEHRREYADFIIHGEES